MQEQDKGRIDAAVDAHTRWLIRLRAATNSGSSEFVPATVKLDHACELGRWLYGEFPERFKNSPIYQDIRKRHASFHTQAAAILELALNGEREKALASLDDEGLFRQSSRDLISLLRQLQKQL